MRDDPLYKLVPGYREAVEHEATIREAAFLPVTESVCGINVLPFTPAHYSMLECANSPFVSGGVPMPEDVALFLWCVSPDYAPRASFRRWRFVRRARRLDYGASVAAIHGYLDDAFGDAPGVKSGQMAASYYSGTAALVDLLAGQYGWSEADILRLPFKRLFQYARCIKERHADKPIFFNRSERILAEWQERDELGRRARVEAAAGLTQRN